jgi:HTH-like domain
MPSSAVEGLRERIATLAAEWPRFGYRRLTALQQHEGVRVGRGRVHRNRKELRLQVPRRKRKRIISPKRRCLRSSERIPYGPDIRTR